jgi:Domain of unknown function (DUF5658)
MKILGWSIVALMVITTIRHLRAPEDYTTPPKKNARLLAVIVSINFMSALDAASTIYLLDHNHSGEMNPVMNLLIGHSYVLFFLVKMSLTLGATLICWHYYERKRRARSILRVTSRVYSLLMWWQCLLLSSVLL